MTASLALHGGKPVRERMLAFGVPFIGDEEIAEVVDTLKSGWISTGPKTKRFEDQFAEYVGARHAVALNSCTGGLHLSLVVSGIGPGDEVIVPSMTFGASANVVGARRCPPGVCGRIDPVTLCLAPSEIERLLTPRTKAVMAVHYGGMPCDMDTINAVAARNGLIVIEDAAHAVGAKYKGKMIGNISPLTNFSFYANKNLSTAEGGMTTTNDPSA